MNSNPAFRLKEARQALGLSQVQLAKKLSLSQSTLAALETGAREIYDRHAKLLEAICGISAVWLMKGEGTMLLHVSPSDLYGPKMSPDKKVLIDAVMALSDRDCIAFREFARDFLNRRMPKDS